MSACAGFQDWPEAGVSTFTNPERARIWAFRLPNDKSGRSSMVRYPREPIESPSKWYADHAAKLRGLERAEGLR